MIFGHLNFRPFDFRPFVGDSINEYNKEETNKLGRTYSSRRFASKDSYGEKNTGEEGSRKIKNNNVGLDGR